MASRLSWFLLPLRLCSVCAAAKSPKLPPRLPSEKLCPKETLPDEWLPRCLAGDLLYGRDLSGGKYPPEVGNGFIATVVQSDVIYAAGLFDGEASNKCDTPTWWCGPRTHRAVIPAYRVRVVEEPWNAPKGGAALDVAQAVYMRRGLITWGEVQLEERWYAPYHEPGLLVHEIELTNQGNEQREIAFAGEGSASFDLELYDVDMQWIGEDPIYAVEGANKAPEIAGGDKTGVAMAATKAPANIVLGPGEKQVVYALTAVATSLNATNPTADVLTLIRRYTQDDGARLPALLKDHIAAWRERAEHGRIEVKGDLSVAQAVNASLYYIRAAVRDDWPHGTSPGGLASNAYNGHTFWDQESWMFPPILALEPSNARAMLQYRFDRMEQSRIKAQQCKPPAEGFMEKLPTWAQHGEVQESWWTDNPWHPRHGFCTESYTKSPHKPYAILFGWETALTGVETNQMDDRYGPWAMFEQHINGDIAFAVRQYWYMTHDLDWLRSIGFPLLNGTASFYAARLVERKGSRGSDGKAAYDLPVVMGPNEYYVPVKNNGYTNAIARITLEFAAEAAGELGLSGEAYHRFSELAAGIYMHSASSVPGRPDLKGGYHPENEGFFKNSTCTENCVKQADTIMLNFPLGVESDSQMVTNDLDFYSTITDPNGPAMTWAIFAVNYFDQKEFKKSGDMFRRGFANMEPPFGVWTEFPSTFENQGAHNFITGAGGFLQSLVFGTSGMRITKDGLTFNPPPPSATGTNATSFTLHSLHYLGSRLRQTVTEDTMEFELLQQGGGITLCLMPEKPLNDTDRTQLHMGKAIKVPREHGSIRACGGEELQLKYLLQTPSGREASSRIGEVMALSLVATAVGAFLVRARSRSGRGRDGDQYEVPSTQALVAHTNGMEGGMTVGVE